MPLFLIVVYAKAKKDDLTPDEKKKVTALAITLKQEYRREF